MNTDELLNYWLYFCSLCSDLEATREYVDHKETVRVDDNNNLIVTSNKDVYSIRFLKLLLATGSEFDIICKLLCREIDAAFDIDNRHNNIAVLTKNILGKYPKIVNTEICTYYKSFKPLESWALSPDNKVTGLEWWDSYNGVKHNRYDKFYNANLEEVVNALGSLLVLEMYLQYHITHNLKYVSGFHYDYFDVNYTNQILRVQAPEKLPDFTIEIV